MNSLASGAPSEYSIRDVIYAEHYARRIAMAVHDQILHFSKDITHQLLSAYPEGSAEYFVVVEALERAGLGMLHQTETVAQTHERKQEIDTTCDEPAVDHLVIKGPWGRS